MSLKLECVIAQEFIIGWVTHLLNIGHQKFSRWDENINRLEKKIIYAETDLNNCTKEEDLKPTSPQAPYEWSFE